MKDKKDKERPGKNRAARGRSLTVRIMAMTLCALLLLTGCGKSGKSASSDGGSGSESASSGGSSGKNKDKSKGDTAKGDSEAGGETAADTEEEKKDKVPYAAAVADPAASAGKLAVYFIKADLANKNFTNNNPGIDMTGGECTLVVAPDGATMMIDFSNGSGNVADAVRLMKNLGITRLDYAVLTGPNAERTGGVNAVMAAVEVAQFITVPTAQLKDNFFYEKFMTAANSKKVPVRSVTEGQSFKLGGQVTVSVFNPAADYDKWSNDAGQRNGSLLLKLTYGNSSYLIGGSLLADAEERLMTKYGEALRADVVKMCVTGNGSKDEKLKDWATLLSPKIAVGEGSLGASELAMGRYAIVSQVALHTALDGICRVSTAGDGTYDVQVEKERKNNAYPELATEKGHMVIN